MCSIFGYCGPCADHEKFKEGFDATVSRGPDSSRIVYINSDNKENPEAREGGPADRYNAARCIGIMAFHRLSIMGLTASGMQPFALDGSLVVCNGEIYGFAELKESLKDRGYTFKSDSDCELLLPLYREFGTEMFKMLDAEYALIIYDAGSGEFIAARDPIGIRPLYYGYDKAGTIIFASEAKNLMPLCDKIMPFPPGHYYKNGEFICYRDITAVDAVCNDDVETACKNIREKLVRGVEKRLISDAKVGFLLSGGLDSSLVCAIAAHSSKKPIRTFAIGMDVDAIDLKYAKQVADFIGSEHTEVIMTKEEVIDSLDFVIKMLGTYDITTIRASMGMYLVCKYIHENTDIRVLLTGEISDELFGYKYTDYAPSPEEFQKESVKRVSELHMYDVLRADRCISVNSLEARVPFGDLDLASYVMSLDPAIKINTYGKGKYLLRHAFDPDVEHAGKKEAPQVSKYTTEKEHPFGEAWLPESILWREKAAFSDAVGHSMVDDLKEYAESLYTDEEFEELSAKYTHAKPFTKESLLYREIFEKYYPGQSEMVADFWMPNKEWENCNVNDPSARVLANYGASGE